MCEMMVENDYTHSSEHWNCSRGEEDHQLSGECTPGVRGSGLQFLTVSNWPKQEEWLIGKSRTDSSPGLEEMGKQWWQAAEIRPEIVQAIAKGHWSPIKGLGDYTSSCAKGRSKGGLFKGSQQGLGEADTLERVIWQCCLRYNGKSKRRLEGEMTNYGAATEVKQEERPDVEGRKKEKRGDRLSQKQHLKKSSLDPSSLSPSRSHRC